MPLVQQVKLRGMRIELTEVEHHLSSFPGVKQALAVVHVDNIKQQHLVGYLSPQDIDIQQLRQHASKFLPKEMVPDAFVLLDQFPKMPNGKADRASLPEPKYTDAAKADYVAPVDGVQAAVSHETQYICALQSYDAPVRPFLLLIALVVYSTFANGSKETKLARTLLVLGLSRICTLII